MANIYRKNAFGCVLHKVMQQPARGAAVREAGANALEAVAKAGEAGAKAGEAGAKAREANWDCFDAHESLVLFSEAIDFSVDGTVPDPVPFCDKLAVTAREQHTTHNITNPKQSSPTRPNPNPNQGMLRDNSAFVVSEEEKALGKAVLAEVGEYTLLDESPHSLETEQV